MTYAKTNFNNELPRRRAAGYRDTTIKSADYLCGGFCILFQSLVL